MMYSANLSPRTKEQVFANFVKMSVNLPENSEEYTPKPEWLKVPKISGETLFGLKRGLREGQLHTVCEEAKCPNISECMNSGTATFMIMGNTCTRGCRFCNVKTGNPHGLLDEGEPHKVALSVKTMGLDYVVLTMVDRDDLPLGGAEHIARTITAIQECNSNIFVEILTGDFQGSTEALKMVLHAGKGLNVFAHNLETVASLTPKVRDRRASYAQSLEVLKNAKALKPEVYTKSGIMLGLGEEPAEIEKCIIDMHAAGVQILTIGQYLQPSPRHLPVKRYVHPWEFQYWDSFATSLGFAGVASGPLVRSSYRAAHLFPRNS